MCNITGLRKNIAKMKELDAKFRSFISEIEHFVKRYRFNNSLILLNHIWKNQSEIYLLMSQY